MTANGEQTNAQSESNVELPTATVAGPFHLDLHVGQARVGLRAPMPLPQGLAQRVDSLLASFEHLMEDASPTVLEEAVATPASEPSPEASPDQKKKDKRGGARNPVISAKIDDLIKTGWLKEKKIADIVQRLKEIGVVSADEKNVYQACLRKLQKSLIRSGTTPADSVFSSVNPVVGSSPGSN